MFWTHQIISFSLCCIGLSKFSNIGRQDFLSIPHYHNSIWCFLIDIGPILPKLMHVSGRRWSYIEDSQNIYCKDLHHLSVPTFSIFSKTHCVKIVEIRERIWFQCVAFFLYSLIHFYIKRGGNIDMLWKFGIIPTCLQKYRNLSQSLNSPF